MTQVRLDAIQAYIEKHFQLKAPALPLEPAFNAAPTELLPVVFHESGQPRFAMMRWGVQSGPRAALVTNARDDSLLNPGKRMFREAAQKRRCCIIADGFYEWQAVGRSKVPHYLYLQGHEPFAFAGLYGAPASPGDPHRCMVVTTEANSLLEKFHNRMPVILPPAKAGIWNSDLPLSANMLGDLCQPYPAELMSEHRTFSRMSNSRYKAADATAPWTPDEGELALE